MPTAARKSAIPTKATRSCILKRQRPRASETNSRIILTSAIGCSGSTFNTALVSFLARLSESDFVRTAQRIGIVPTNKEAKCGEIWGLPALEDGNLHSLEIAGAYYQVVAVPGRLSVRRGRAALDRKREIESRFGGEAAHAHRALYARQFLYAWQGLLQEALQGSGPSISID